jgi:alanine dehydrogenase
MENGGSGVLLPGVEGVEPGAVVVLGAGNVGANAVDVAVGIGARTTVFARSRTRLDALAQRHRGRLDARLSEMEDIAACVEQADLVVGGVLTPGRLSPKLIRRETVARMRPGSVIVDVGIDQGGISETSRPTSHSAPLYLDAGVLHYCVPNMPSACARTATLALTNATLPYLMAIAARGLKAAIAGDAGLACGLQVSNGRITYPNLASDTGRLAVEIAEAFA